ncbi:FadR/GntR family transcriptional regulator [Pseudarthrobacter oxydans]|uniref:FadR/GntR family transcriptional regulator n=1 Tax=Pseudarthrobacter oxydans TaxID=1671 RepID=UPI00344877CB
MRQNLSQSVAKQLLRAIETGEFLTGEKLPAERHLMERYEVGRNTIREAVQSLVSQGVLDVRPGRGTTVRSLDGRAALEQQSFSSRLSDTAIDDVYEFRMLLETDAAAKAAERADEQDRAEVAAALKNYEDAVNNGTGMYRRDVEFHAAIAHASKNTAYSAALEAVANTLVAARQATDTVPGAVEQALIEHRAIARYILDGNVGAARAAMVMHIETARWTLTAAREAQKMQDNPVDGALPVR